MRKHCGNCRHDEWERDNKFDFLPICLSCEYVDENGLKVPSNWKPQTQTNADRIRAMSDEELAKWMSGGALHSDSVCSYCDRNKMEFCDGAECSNKTDAEIILDWLKQPVKDGEGE